MSRNLKKMCPVFAVSLVLTTSCINAADNADMNRSKSNMDMQKQQQKGSMGMITPPVNPVVQGVDFSFGIEALYMRATRDCSSVGLREPSPSAYPQAYTAAEQQYDWSWGARVDAGYAMNHDGWDLQAQWTWFKASETNIRTAAPGASFYSSMYPTDLNNSPVVTIETGSLNSHRHMLINMGDLDLGREFFISKWLTLRPCAGIRGVWIERHRTIDAINVFNVPSGVDANTSQVTSYTDVSYNAGGLYAGLDTQWSFGDGWSLFGMVDQAIVYGRNDYNHYEVDRTLNGAVYTRAAVSDKYFTVRGITDLALGFRWDYMFDNDRYNLRLQAAWEEHVFSNLTVHNFGKSGDLALTGASFKVGFDF